MPSKPRHARASFSDRLLAEALRLREDDGRAPIDDPLAELKAQATEGDLEAKIIMRARAAQHAGKLRDALRQLHSAIGWIVILGLLIAFLIGAGAARATLDVTVGPERNIANFYWVLGGVLGVQTIALLAWIVVMIVSSIAAMRMKQHDQQSSFAAGSLISLGALVIGAARWLAGRLARDAHQVAAISAAARAYSSGPLGRWTFSSITHALWLAFNVGCLAMVMYLLTARDYTFVWETTILRSEHYVNITGTIAYLPEQIGVITPNREQVIASRWPAPDDATPGAAAARHAWAGLLVGSIVVYGFAPRILLLGFSLGKRRLAKRRYRLDLSLPGFARLESRLIPRSAAIGKTTTNGEAEGLDVAAPHRQLAPRSVSSSHALIGLEITRPAGATGAWPPSIHCIHWDDLGIVEGRDDQRAILERLESSPTEPASLVIVCALTSTPDRGLARFIAEAQARLTRPIAIVLTAGQTLRDRGYSADAIAQRVGDWRNLAQRAGVESDRIVELDLDHFTEAGRKRLKELLAPDESGGAAPQRTIERAFELIAQGAANWERSGAPPPLEQQADLHRRIAQLHQSDALTWRQTLNLPSSIKEDFAQHIRTGAERVQSLLPDRLLKSPKWIAAGALSGALGCIAAATLISPIAIGALPMWSGIGAAIAAIWQPASRKKDETAAAPSEGPDLGDAIRAAALFAMLLELQGRDEATITRILDEAIGEDTDARITSARDSKQWLDNVRHRFDISLAQTADARR